MPTAQSKNTAEELGTIGRRARLLRVERGWTQEELARRAGVTANTVRGFERARLKTTTEAVTKILKALGTTRETLTSDPHVGDPALRNLNPEDFLVAQAYHHAPSKVRAYVTTLLFSQRDPAEIPELRALAEVDKQMVAEFARILQSAADAARLPQQQPMAPRRKSAHKRSA